MAKKSTKNAAKITKAELDLLQGLQQSISNTVNNLANIEIAKFELLHEHAKLKEQMQEASATLQEKYGKVNIALVDGTISEIEESSEEA